MISQPSHSGAITLLATTDSGSIRRYTLQPDQGVFVGRSSNCGLQLQGNGIADIQCRIEFEEGELCVHTWMSAEGTRVNGQPILDKAELHLGDAIQIGRNQIVLESYAAAKDSDERESEQINDEYRDAPAAVSEPAGEPIALSSSPAPQDSLPQEATERDDFENRAEPKDDEPANGFAFGCAADTPESMELDFFDFEEEETYDRETVALLHAEIEELQSALAQRDADAFANRNESSPGSDSTDPAEESDEVLARMQELIDEANRSDERVALLEEMLHASEVAKRSEQDERAQLEAWVGDIEKRVGQREDEHVAEVEALRRRLEQSNLQQEKLQRQLQQAAFSGSVPQQYEETLENLQSVNKELQEKLADSEKCRLSLEQKLEEVSGEQDRALREERAVIAKERAQVSRLRFELSSKLTEIEELPKAENEADRETARRIQTLREHLREIHEQEKVAEKEAPLTTRLAKLWKRVEY